MQVPRETIQRSRQWFLDRMGKFTGSNLHRLLGAQSTRARYIEEVIRERALLAAGGETLDTYINKMMAVDARPLAWGRKYEPAARARLELLLDTDITEIGFFVCPDMPFFGCSVDGLLADQMARAIAEIKCPYDPDVHAATRILGIPVGHKPQAQGNMMGLGADLCHFVSFDPRATPDGQFYHERVKRDDGYISGILMPALIEAEDWVRRGEVPTNDRSTIPALF